jgi:antitoxin component of MazEF toxin-antitoxin module
MEIKFVDLENDGVGVIIPNFMLEQLGFPNEFYLKISNEKIILTPINKNIAQYSLLKICKIKLSVFKHNRQNQIES